MELDRKTKKMLLTIAAVIVEMSAMVIAFFTEWYFLCVDNNFTFFVMMVLVCDLAIHYWYDLRKKMENM